MTDYGLHNVAAEDIEDLLQKVESSFDIEFVGDELAHIRTFGQLCDHIINKIQLDNSESCTSQQAFYKLRESISKTALIDKKEIFPDLSLADILPRKSRRSRTKQLEKHLGFQLNILRPSHWLSGILLILLVASFVGLFFKWQIGLTGIGLAIFGLWFAQKIGNELDLQTLGQVAEKMARENYLKSRRHSGTVNRNEIEKVLTDWFRDDLALEKSKLTRDAKFA